ncbi:SDR family NAD(P)-dependent oxidoreductase [Demequina oxidasica]|uniref:SDR family NAD(P)-dependent oxidoreductase n=1 Tax=Demequina oxidasica TaxID=676199 RepID=UPI000781E8BE|nr:SDR family oxidoreductase [Demequina oxidasica]
MTRRRFNATGKVVVVTGGGGGIGGAFARQIADRGATVILVDIRPQAADAVVASLADSPGAAVEKKPGHRVLVGDLTQRTDVERILADIEANEGHIDVLVNNAGMTSAERFDERSAESIELELNVNLYAPLMLTRLAIPLLRAGTDPRVVTTVSLGGIFPLGETPIYTASKFGLRGAMLAISLDLRDKGITAGSVLPSATDTRMLRYEALEGGNEMQFQDPPQSPEHVAATMIKLLDRPRLEVYPRPSESWLVRIALLVPNQLPRLMPLFRGKGERGLKKYIASLRERGIVETVDGVDRLVV